METLRNNNFANSINSLDGGSVFDLTSAASHGSFGGHYGGYNSYVCCENGVDLGTLLALLAGKLL